MTVMEGLLSGLLGLTLLVLALRILFVRDLFHAVVLFIAFGFLMAAAWVILSAPDVALAEAGIGAALTGVLLLDALHNLRWKPLSSGKDNPALFVSDRADRVSRLVRIATGAGAVVLLFVLLLTVAGLPAEGSGLAPVVEQAMAATGVSHPVTAILLNFRIFDTLLELIVLLAAVLGVLCVRGERGLSKLPHPAGGDNVVNHLLRILLPLLTLIAFYLLWLGTFTAGGAFQAGIVVAACVVLLWLTGHRTLEEEHQRLWPPLLSAGVVAFCLTGLIGVMAGEAFLQLPREWDYAVILFLEIVAALSIGALLAALFLALHPPGGGPHELHE